MEDDVAQTVGQEVAAVDQSFPRGDTHFAKQINGYRRDDVDRYIAALNRRIAELDGQLAAWQASCESKDAMLTSMRNSWAPADEILERTEAARAILLAAVRAASIYQQDLAATPQIDGPAPSQIDEPAPSQTDTPETPRADTPETPRTDTPEPSQTDAQMSSETETQPPSPLESQAHEVVDDTAPLTSVPGDAPQLNNPPPPDGHGHWSDV